MPVRHVIVDGSNLATEGRSLPSLVQLDQAVREFLAENPTDVVTVVVDASFGHRIPSTEVPMFEEAEAAGELVSPPAGAIGRGDAFLLRIAEKTGATVLSNDSFQEFHGEHAWLFDDGRLIGGKPVPGVGWIFLPRTPVRGQRSREVVKEAKRKKRADDATDAGSGESGLDLAASRARGRAKKVDRAIARATEEAVEPKAKGRRRRRAGGAPPAEPVDEPLAFITFIATHPLGSQVVGTVLEFSSHGAFVRADQARCYLPLSAMGDPPPRRAREVLVKGEDRDFVVQALDPLRRGIELALPGYARVAGGPTDETVEAEIHPQVEATPKRRRRDSAEPAVDGSAGGDTPPLMPALVGGGLPNGNLRPTDGETLGVGAPARRAAAEKGASPGPASEPPQAGEGPAAAPETVHPPESPARTRPRKAAVRAAASRAVPGAATATPPGPEGEAAETAPAEKMAAKKVAAKKVAAKKAAAPRAALKKAAAEEGLAERTSATRVANRAAAPGKKAVGQKVASTTPAKKTATKKAPADKMAATQVGATKAAAKKTPAKAAPAKTATTATPAEAGPVQKASAGRATASTAPVSTAPVSTAPVSTAPARTAPARTAPVSTAPVSTAPVSTAPAEEASPVAEPVSRQTPTERGSAPAAAQPGQAGAGPETATAGARRAVRASRARRASAASSTDQPTGASEPASESSSLP